MNITRHTGPDRSTRLALDGELDLGTVNVLTEHVAQALAVDRPGRLVLDLAKLRFCDSTGVGALIEARAAAVEVGASFQTTNVGGMTETTLRIVGVLDILNQITAA